MSTTTLPLESDCTELVNDPTKCDDHFSKGKE